MTVCCCLSLKVPQKSICHVNGCKRDLRVKVRVVSFCCYPWRYLVSAVTSEAQKYKGTLLTTP